MPRISNGLAAAPNQCHAFDQALPAAPSRVSRTPRWARGKATWVVLNLRRAYGKEVLVRGYPDRAYGKEVLVVTT